MRNVRRLRKDGWVKWRGEWYQASSNRADRFVGQWVYVDDPLDGTITLFTCNWLKRNGRQTVGIGGWISEAN